MHLDIKVNCYLRDLKEMIEWIEETLRKLAGKFNMFFCYF